MKNVLEFEIISSGEISTKFLSRNILTFKEAALFISKLPYGRNKNKNDLSTIFNDGCGTCSTKHALLKTLADENNFDELKLIVGLFKMSGANTPQVAETLKKSNLEYIPEAHNYLKYNNLIFDFTKTKPFTFINDLLGEIEIAPDQITDFKVNYHKNYLTNWLKENDSLKFTPEELWEIREQCILDLATK